MRFYNRKGILYVSVGGKRISTKLEDNPKNRKLAESYYKNDEFFTKFSFNRKVPYFNDLIDIVILDKEKSIKHSTYVSYAYSAEKRIKPFFDGLLVTEIKPSDIYRFYKLFKDRSSLIIANVLLKQAFQIGIIEEYITSTPLVVAYPKFKTNYKKNPFTLGEINLLLAADSKINNFIGVAVTTGMRGGEIIGLKWQDIDFLNNKINICRTIKDGVEQTPKTKNSFNSIDLPFESKVYFQNQLKLTGLKNTYVFLNDGKRYNSLSVLTYWFKKLLLDLSLEDRGIHQLRHTFASLKLSYGERLEWVSFMLRHESLAFTQNVYYKYIPRPHEKRVVLEFDKTQKLHNIV